jgi:putative ABC transport system permease protein
MTPETALTAVSRGVSPEFFPAMQIPVREGRNFTRADGRGSPGVAIVNETFARRFLTDGNVLGQRLRYTESAGVNQLSERTVDEMEIIGVVGDVKYDRLADPAPPAIYLSSEQLIYRRLTAVVRTVADNPETLVGAIRGELEALDPMVTAQFDAYAPIVRASTARERLAVLLLAAFGFMAMVLAAVGIYGLMSYSVTQRTGEIAVRSALGASSGQLVRLVLYRGLRLALAGIALGTIAAVSLRQVVASQLFGVSPLDGVVFVSVPFLLLSVALVATFIPASRVRSVDPADMLREG